jgi:hypothetical protein
MRRDNPTQPDGTDGPLKEQRCLATFGEVRCDRDQGHTGVHMGGVGWGSKTWPQKQVGDAETAPPPVEFGGHL